MKNLITITFLSLLSLTTKSQSITKDRIIDAKLAQRITIDNFCLCETSVRELNKLDSELKEVDVEEMDMCKGGFVQDARFINSRGFYSSKFHGIIFQKENETDLISKIRLNKEFKGNLPDGNFIDMTNLTAREVLKLYPKFDTWKSRGCSDYWKLTNDTLSFYVRIDKSKTPQYPVDEAYYLDKQVEGIDIVIDCYSIFRKNNKPNLFPENEPLFFLDSIRVNKGVINQFDQSEFSFISVYKGENAIKIAGNEAKNGAIYLITREYAREKYWTYFKSKSKDYEKVVMNLEIEKSVKYILDNKKLERDFEKDLFDINDTNLLDIRIINDNKTKKKYKIEPREIGVMIKTN